MVNTDPLRRFVVRLFWLRPFTVPHTNPDSSISHTYLKASVPDGNVGSEEKAESQGIVVEVAFAFACVGGLEKGR